MSEHLLPSQIDRYRRRKLSAEDLQSIDDHIGGCKACRELLNEQIGNLEQKEGSLLANWTDMLAGVGAETVHLSYEQVAGYLDRKFEPERLQDIKRHLNDCAECEERVQTLRAFRDETEASPLIIKSEAPVPPRESLFSLWQPFTRLSTLQLAPPAALAALLLAAIVWLVWTTGSPTSPPLAVSLDDGGGRVTLDAQGNIVTPRQVPPPYLEMMKLALTTQQVKLAPALAGLFGTAGQLRGAAGDGIPFALVGPVGTVVETDKPTLRWQPLSGATTYTVTVSNRENEVATSPPLSVTEWSVPQTLPRGVIYSWQVTALKDGEEITSPVPPAPDARFKVLKQNTAQELELARKNYAGMHLLLGNLYAEVGLLDDAEAEFEALLAANPQSPVARKLLHDVRSSRRAN